MELSGAREIFQSVGALLAVALTIFIFFGYIVSFLKWIRSGVVRLRKLYRERRWFGKYKPSWEIVNSGVVEVLETENKYSVKLSVEIRYKSNDNRYNSTIYLRNAKVVLWHKRGDREGDRYELNDNSITATVEICPLGEYTAAYTFIKELGVRPLLDEGGQAKYCVYPGAVVVWNVPGIRDLKVGHKRTAQIIHGGLD